MGIYDSIKEFIIKIFWPFFLEHIWPFIKIHMIDIVKSVIEFLKQLIKDTLDEKQKERQRQAEHEAAEAEANAKAAVNEEEIEKYKEIAKVWRKIAEQYRIDNEDLKRKFDEEIDKTSIKATNMIQKDDITADFTGLTSVIRIGDKTKEFPAIP